MLENKPILSTTEVAPKSSQNKTEIKNPSSNKHVIELSCDSYNGLLSSTESKTLTRLNGLIGDNMVAFVKAKEEFKRKRSLPGILYRYYLKAIFRKFSSFANDESGCQVVFTGTMNFHFLDFFGSKFR